MRIYKQIFVIFTILVVQRACKETTEKYEETKLEVVEESFPIDGDSTHPESEFSDNRFSKMDKSFKLGKLSHKEAKDAEDFSESEHFTTNTPITNSTHSELNFPTEETQERSDLTEDFEAPVNRKYQLRGLKDYKVKSGVQDGEEKISDHERKIISLLNDEPVNLKLNKRSEKESILDSIYDSISMEHITYRDGDKKPYKVVDVKKYFAAFRDMGIDPAYLTQGSTEALIKVHQIHKNFIDFIEKDIRINTYPYLFYQTLAPVFKDKILPHLIKPNVMKAVQQLVKSYEIKRLVNILLDLTNLPKYETEKDSSSILKLNEFFASSKIENNDNNKKLARQYERNLKNLQEIIENDWVEYNAPASFINYLLIYCKEEPFISRTEMLFQQIRARKENITLPTYREDSSKDEDSDILKWYQWAKNLFGFGRTHQEL